MSASVSFLKVSNAGQIPGDFALMNSFFALLDRSQNILKNIGAACLMAMALLTGADIIGRLNGSPIFGSEELVTILATLALAFSLPYAHAQRSHIGVEILIRLFPRRIRRRIKLATNIASLALFSVVTWRMALYAGTIKESGELSMNLALPEYYVIYVLSFCFFIFTLFILKDVLTFFNKAEK